MVGQRKKRSIWNLFDNLGGDKVVWIITLLLVLISIVCIFSSTSKLLGKSETRVDMMLDRVKMVAIGLGIIFLCYKIKNVNVFRWFSQFGFIISLALLIPLAAHINSPILEARNFNNAYRILELKVSGHSIQIHVFEIVKVAMIMYFAWALDTIKNDRFKLAAKLSAKAKKIVFMYLPFILVFVLVLMGSNSSAIIIGGVLFFTILIGGGDRRDMLLMTLVGLLTLCGCYGIYKISGGKVLERMATLEGRFSGDDENYERQAKEAPANSIEFNEAIDRIQQPYGAKIAIHQGGLIGKGPGQSTQRYIVPDMPDDYMYSFIVEEYGLVGGIIVLILYISLLARGSIIVRNCGKNLFAKSAVAGLCLLITGQAFLHMLVNVDIGPMTGQTLPLISHGNSAFLCFSLAFGIILSLSRIAAEQIEKETREAQPIIDLDIDVNDVSAAEDMLYNDIEDNEGI